MSNMSIQKSALLQVLDDHPSSNGHAAETPGYLEASCRFNIYSDGILHEVIKGRERDARYHVLRLTNLWPGTEWSFEQVS